MDGMEGGGIPFDKMYEAWQARKGGLSAFLGNLFNDPRKPYADAQRAYDPWMDKAAGGYKPFYDEGVNAMNPFKDRLNEMKNPGDFLNKIMGEYKQSDWAKNKTDSALRAAQNAASASGLIGSTPYLEASEKIAGDISNEDMERWLQDYLGVNKDYMGGWDKFIQRGFGSAEGLGNIFSGRARDEAQLAYDKSRAGQQRTGGIVGGLVDFFL